MKKKPSKRLEKYRVRSGVLRSDKSFGNNGAFEIPYRKGFVLTVVASDKLGWEHVSVSLPTITPTWAMMCFVKDLFWDDHETVAQFHPQKDSYVNFHPHCLHMWAPVGYELPTPPEWMVGPK